MRHQLLVVSCLLLAGCATSADVPTVLSQSVDSALVHQAQQAAARLAVQRLSTGRIKFKGPVTLQIGGTGNTGSSTDATKAKAPVAAAPHAVATDASKKGGTPWQVFAGLAALCAGVGIWLGAKFSWFNFLK